MSIASYCKKPTVINASDYLSGSGVEDDEFASLATAAYNATVADTQNAGVRIEFAAGTYTLTANNQQEAGVLWQCDFGKRLHFQGAGKDATIFKRNASATLGPDSGHHFLYQRTGAGYSFSGIKWDGNEQNMPIVAPGNFFYEHCGETKFYSVNLGMPDYVKFHDCEWTNCIADGWHGNSFTRRFEAIRCEETNRTRRPRAGISHTNVPVVYAEHSNCNLEALENEPHLQPTEGSRYVVKNCTIRGAWDMNRCFLEADNVTVLAIDGVGLPFANFYQLGEGSYLRNCSIRDIERFQENYGLLVEDCDITCVEALGENRDPEFWMDDGGDVTLRRVSLTTESSASTGKWLSSARSHTEFTPTLTLEDITIEKPLDYFLGGATQGATMVIKGGNLSANTGIFAASSTVASQRGRVEVTANNTWSGVMIDLSTTFIGVVQIALGGTFNADNLELADRAPVSTPNLQISGTMQGTKTTAPDGSYQGLPGVVISSGGTDYTFNESGWIDSGPTPME